MYVKRFEMLLLKALYKIKFIIIIIITFGHFNGTYSI